MKLFNAVQGSKPKSNMFDLSFENKLTCKMGDLVPVYLQEIVPGDHFKRIQSEMLIRYAPLTAPMMHQVNAYVHFWFVPRRLTFANWEKFLTGGEDGKQVVVPPTLKLVNAGDEAWMQKGTLWDYLGLPTQKTSTPLAGEVSVLACPFRAYQLIYNEFYRDQNLIPKLNVLNTDGYTYNEVATIGVLRKRAWEREYFSSCLPFSQRGDEVMLPNELNYKTTSELYKTDGTPHTHAVEDLQVGVDGKLHALDGDPLGLQNLEGINITINDLRRSARIQEFLEKTARGGSRIGEVIRQFFGVTPPDYRIQRPEFLGGQKVPVSISEVLQTYGPADGTNPLATMGGHGISVGTSGVYNKFFTEHGYILGILSVQPRSCYASQGMPKGFKKFDRYDYYWPTFAQLGEQPVLSEEVYCDMETYPYGDTDTFGYQSRYAEYKANLSQVHGDLKDEKDFWHMNRIFTEKPLLNQSFIECNPDARVFALTDPAESQLFIQIYHKIHARRPMPYFNTPTL